jgi:XTP/dITP diphosphohydrolase
MRIVLATRNRDKVGEIRRILDGLDIVLAPVDESAPETVEDGATLDENALKKAREARDFSGWSALADDTGLEVDALDGAPGIRAARYAGEGASYVENYTKLLANLEGVADAQRTARFRTVIALALNVKDAERLGTFLAAHPDVGAGLCHEGGGVDALQSEGMLPGSITTRTRGESGFGYDPVFFDPAAGKTLAEMTSEEKNATSHRYRALIEMRELMLRLELVYETT